MDGKALGFLKSVFHNILHPFHEVVLIHKGKSNQWIPVTSIECKTCGKIFYKRNK